MYLGLSLICLTNPMCKGYVVGSGEPEDLTTEDDVLLTTEDGTQLTMEGAP
jgi:hypothetical protein